MNGLRFFTLLVVVWLTGCAGSAEYLRSQPVTYFQPTTDLTVPGLLAPYIKLRCMKARGSVTQQQDAEECLYISADASQLLNAVTATTTAVATTVTSTASSSTTVTLSATQALRDQTIAFLMSVSDMNCSNFLHRAFAQKASMDLSKGFLGDLATGLSAGTAHADPRTSAALSLGNLIVGKGVESVNATYFYNGTFQAMESAIAAERIRIKTFIIAKQSTSYEMTQALSDIRAYDDACSFRVGVAQLVQLADIRKKQNDDARVCVELAQQESKLRDARKLLTGQQGANCP